MSINYVFKESSFRIHKGFLILLITFCSLYQINAQNISAEWSSPTAGVLDSIGFTFTNLSNNVVTWDLSTTDYEGAPLSASEDIHRLASNDLWSVTFDNPVTNPRVYFIYYQPGAITFNITPTFLSGENFSTSGNDVVISSAANSSSGVVEFQGVHSTITVTASTATPRGSVTAITFGMGDPSAMPVELHSFKAEADREMVQLNWETASELNNDGFEIERSSNGKDFKEVGFVEGEGTTTKNSSYQFIDETPFSGLNYYRLKQLDFDGAFEYSDIIAIENKTEEITRIKLYPNPVQNQLTVSNAIGLLTIYDQLGRKVETIANESEFVEINTSEFKQGYYVLHVQKSDGEVIIQRFIK